MALTLDESQETRAKTTMKSENYINLPNKPPLVLIVLLPEKGVEMPPGLNHKVYVVFKQVKADSFDERFMIASSMNVIIPDMQRIYDLDEVLALHQKIKLQIREHRQIEVQFLFHGK